MDRFANDFRHAVRTLAANPGFSLMTILMLALGIGACTSIFTVVNGVLLRPLPYPDPNSLAQLWELSDKGRPMRLPEANFLDWKAENHSFKAIAMYGLNAQPMVGRSERLRIAEVSQGFFDVLQARASVGTVFLPEHLRPAETPSAVISYPLWQGMFAGDPNLAGKQLTFFNRTYAVIGAMPADFSFPQGTDVWISHEASGRPRNPNRSSHNWSVIGRLNPGVSVEAASKEFDEIAARIHRQYADVTAVGATAVPLKKQLTNPVNSTLQLLSVTVGLLLLIACANVSNLILVHTGSRAGELAVRAALGASRGSLARLFLLQTSLLTAAGGALGALLSTAGVRALLSMSPENFPRISEIHADRWVLSFAVMTSLLVGVLVGLFPAIRVRYVSLSDALKQSGRSASEDLTRRLFRQWLVVVQVAFTVILLIGTMLLGRSLLRILQIDLGFQTESRVAFNVLIPQERDAPTRQRDANRYQELVLKISEMPGVTAVGGTGQLPLAGSSGNGRFKIEGGTDSGTYWPTYRIAMPGYFEVMKIPLLQGRLFDETDGASSPQVALISKTVADTVWPGQNPIGKRINYANFDADDKFMTIVGIVGDVRYAPEIPGQGDVYVHYLQRGTVDNFTVVIHAAGDTQGLVRQITSEIRNMNPIASLRVQTFEQMFSGQTANRRFSFVLLGTFGATALVLALMGVYAITAYSVLQRKREIAIRLALGAQKGDVTGMFVAEGVKLAATGVAIGVAGAIAVTGWIRSMLFGVQPTDLNSYLIVIISMIGAAVIAGLFPARRAARLDPAVTMRQTL